MNISLIVAHDKKMGIGAGNNLPWAKKIPKDMTRFKELTSGHTVIMGRKTYDSMGRALPNRTNIVLTRDKTWHATGVLRAHSLKEALALVEEDEEEVFVIGGSALFQEALPLVNIMYITEIDATFDCDVFFPEYDKNEWLLSTDDAHKKDLKNAFDLRFLTSIRKK